MSFTWFNVNAGYKNQLIKYSSDNGSTFKNITFPGWCVELYRFQQIHNKSNENW